MQTKDSQGILRGIQLEEDGEDNATSALYIQTWQLAQNFHMKNFVSICLLRKL